MTEQSKIVKVCAKCGSDDITLDACARWCPETGAWELSSTYDDAYCGKCEAEITEITDEPLMEFALQITKSQWTSLVRAIKEDLITQSRMVVEDGHVADTIEEAKKVAAHLFGALDQLDAMSDEKLMGEDEATQAAYKMLKESVE